MERKTVCPSVFQKLVFASLLFAFQLVLFDRFFPHTLIFKDILRSSEGLSYNVFSSTFFLMV